MKNSLSLKWIIKNSKKHLPLIAVLTVLEAVISVVYIVLSYISSFVLDIAIGQKQGNIYTYIAVLFFLILLQIILYVVNSSLKVRIGGKLEIHLKSAMFSSLTKKKFRDIEHIHSGDILNRFTSDVDVVISGIMSIVPTFISLLARLAAALYVIAKFSTSLVAIIVIIGAVVGFSAGWYSKFFKSVHKKVQEAGGNTRSFMQECTENLVVVKTFNSSGALDKRLKALMDKTYKLKLKRNLVRNIANVAIYMLFTGGYYLALSWGAFMISGSGMTYGTLTAMLAIISQIRGPITNVSGLVPQYYSALASAERIMELENLENEPSPLNKSNIEKLYSDLKAIKLEDVDFSYDGQKYILKGCNMIIEKGSTVALVGGSGEGKSTIFKGLLSIYSQNAGRISLEGTDKQLTADMRGLFAYVPQGNMILSGTIRDNLTFMAENISDEEIFKALKIASLDEFVLSLEGGLNTHLGERGLGLSEGQIQRVSIARAILSGAPILLLDECTSALDEKTERTVLDNIKALKTKTAIIITHRPRALEICDKIYSVENGGVALIER